MIPPVFFFVVLGVGSVVTVVLAAGAFALGQLDFKLAAAGALLYVVAWMRAVEFRFEFNRESESNEGCEGGEKEGYDAPYYHMQVISTTVFALCFDVLLYLDVAW